MPIFDPPDVDLEVRIAQLKAMTVPPGRERMWRLAIQDLELRLAVIREKMKEYT